MKPRHALDSPCEYFTASTGERFYLSPDEHWLMWEKGTPTPADEAHRGLISIVRKLQTKPTSPLEELLNEVIKKHSISLEAIFEKNREANVVAARQDFAIRARRAGYSLPRIGKAVHRDHSTIFYLLKKGSL
jgi:hypothetical protein